jgi:RND family efflux transporter MFP subunit
MHKIFNIVKKQKISFAIFMAILVAAGFFIKNSFGSDKGETTYNTAAAEKGTLITSISGTGQVSAANQVDVKAAVSGDVISVPVKVGNEIKKGALIAKIDPTQALQDVRDAQTNLNEAKEDLQKLKEPADELTLSKAEGSFLAAQQARATAETNFKKVYSDGYNTVGTIILNLQSTISVLTDLGSNQLSILNGISYDTIQTQYNKVYTDYKKASPYSEASVLDILFNETYEILKNINIAMRAADKTTYITSTNTSVSSVATLMQSVQTASNSLATAERSLREQEISLADVKNGATEDELKAQEKIITQKENALDDANDQLKKYYITAPFDGIIADLNVTQGDSIASISSYGTIATIITKNKIVTVSLNEVDSTNVKVSQKANLTFDAIDGLSVVGGVSQVDTIGTVNSGVVTYNVSIAFDSQDDRIKPGMSASASIITQAKQDVILVPISAVKSSGDISYVEVLNKSDASSLSKTTGVTLKNPLTQTEVTVGLSNDDSVEILTGLNVGDVVVTKTINSSKSTSGSSSSNSASSKIQSQSSGLLQSVSGGEGERPAGGPGF